MAVSFTTLCANAMLKGMLNHIIDGPEKVILRIYAGTPPANANINLSSTNTLLASFETNPAFAPDPVDKTLTANPFTPSTALESGTATFFRLGRTATFTFLQGSASAAGGNGDLKLDKSALTKGEEVRVNEVKFILP